MPPSPQSASAVQEPASGFEEQVPRFSCSDAELELAWYRAWLDLRQRLTQRMAGDESVTRRLDPASAVDADLLVQQVTARLHDQAALMSVLQLRAGNQIADRYRVQAGPLGGISGEAEIYRCLDERSGSQVVVKLYRHNMVPKLAVLKSLLGLKHPDIVTISNYGSWTGRFYEAMEYCEGGSMADVMPLSEQQLREHIGQIINGLRYCHRQGIIHRDIKPSNLFFRDAARSESVLGDFGISSILDSDNEGGRVTQTAANLTLDYAAPELLDGHKVTAYPGVIDGQLGGTSELLADPVVSDGRVITSRGPGTAMDFALSLIETLAGDGAVTIKGENDTVILTNAGGLSFAIGGATGTAGGAGSAGDGAVIGGDDGAGGLF